MAVQLSTLLREAHEHVCPTPPVAGAVPVVRRRADAVLAEWRVCPHLVEDALLVVSELLTNAIAHALPPVVLRLSWVRHGGPGTLRVEVTDGGPARPAGGVRTGTDLDEHGRGEGIVRALANRYGIRIHPGGVTRWAELGPA
ncbi:ATP-binding protein [Streptomyces sp. TG1A-8]|uniref:ATP-binding protein n=1 Tax=Streptomyces sp. TG1A-8 TaxID=3051385 RepID=UPI00265BBE48|nr:ATP-binding protein [Streptomyces sp. TG1A-8]MDO0929304.1 ATP-binding protein [Streptomyces sp. TG1A-8]